MKEQFIQHTSTGQTRLYQLEPQKDHPSPSLPRISLTRTKARQIQELAIFRTTERKPEDGKVRQKRGPFPRRKIVATDAMSAAALCYVLTVHRVRRVNLEDEDEDLHVPRAFVILCLLALFTNLSPSFKKVRALLPFSSPSFLRTRVSSKGTNTHRRIVRELNRIESRPNMKGRRKKRGEKVAKKCLLAKAQLRQRQYKSLSRVAPNWKS